MTIVIDTAQGEIVIYPALTGERPMWTVSGDLREGGAWDTNYLAQEAVVAVLAVSFPALNRRLQFDPEMSCFFAYAETLNDAQDLAAVISAVSVGASS